MPTNLTSDGSRSSQIGKPAPSMEPIYYLDNLLRKLPENDEIRTEKPRPKFSIAHAKNLIEELNIVLFY